MSTILQPLRAGRFRHVVFASGYAGRRVVDFAAPAPATTATPPRQTRFAPDEESFVRLLFEATGLDARAYRTETLRRRLPAALRAIHATSLRHARLLLQQDPALRWPALSAMIIGVTSFLRDAAVFDHLLFHALPNLAGSLKQLRIWSAGCSDGEELYSVAVLLSELKLIEGAHLLGTDCRGDAIARAREGLYHEEALKEVCPPWLDKYFSKESTRYRISAELRAIPTWRRADVLAVGEPGYWDMILCRNMGMYLTPECAGRLWHRLEQQLCPGGYLVLGKAERPLGTTRLSTVAPCVYRRDRG